MRVSANSFLRSWRQEREMFFGRDGDHAGDSRSKVL